MFKISYKEAKKIISDSVAGESPIAYRYETNTTPNIKFYASNIDYVLAYIRTKNDVSWKVSDATLIEKYGIKPIQLNINNPLKVNMSDENFANPNKEQPFIDKALKENYDSVIFTNNIDKFYVLVGKNKQADKETKNYFIFDYKDHKIFIPKQIHTTGLTYGIESYYITPDGLKIMEPEYDRHKVGEENWQHKTLEDYQGLALQKIKALIDNHVNYKQAYYTYDTLLNKLENLFSHYYGSPKNKDEVQEKIKLIVDKAMNDLHSNDHKLRTRLYGILRNKIIAPQQEVNELNVITNTNIDYIPEVED